MYTLLKACNKSVLKNKRHSIELINHGIICQIIEKSIKLNFEKHILFPISAKKARLQNIYYDGS